MMVRYRIVVCPLVALALYMNYHDNGVNYKAVGAVLATDAAFVAMVWAMMIYTPKRAPGYDWGDIKLHED